MELSQCKTCNHHITVISDKVLCGFKIDREEKQIKPESDGSKIVLNCPKEN